MSPAAWSWDPRHGADTRRGRRRTRLRGFLFCGAFHQSLDERVPSAETLLHLQIYRHFPEVRVVFHPHSVNATVLSRLCGDTLILQDYEILKAFPGIDSHDGEVLVPVFENDQNIARLADKVAARLLQLHKVHGYLIRGHGFYTWGDSMEDALRHVEAFEFLFDCELRLRGLQ